MQAPTFEAFLEGEAGAPLALPLPQPWADAAGDVVARLGAGESGGGAPPLIVVCGSKKVGKSTFGRFLCNSLLGQHPCVAYLDTGERGAPRCCRGA